MTHGVKPLGMVTWNALLIQRGADVCRALEGQAAHNAAQRDNVEMLRLLIATTTALSLTHLKATRTRCLSFDAGAAVGEMDSCGVTTMGKKCVNYFSPSTSFTLTPSVQWARMSGTS